MYKNPNMLRQLSRLLNIRDKIKQGLRWEIENCQNIDFQKDVWTGDKVWNLLLDDVEPIVKLKEFINVNGNWDIYKLDKTVSTKQVKDILLNTLPITC